MPIDENTLYRAIGARLRELRIAQDSTQTEVAAAIGIERTSVTNIEKGRQKTPLHVLYSLCEHFDVEVISLLPPRAELMTKPTSKRIKIGNEEREVSPELADVLERLIQSHDKEG